jgi:hypothetical protein
MSEKAENKAKDEKAEGKKSDKPAHKLAVEKMPKEIGGPTGPEPTRYGDWERKGIVSDF